MAGVIARSTAKSPREAVASSRSAHRIAVEIDQIALDQGFLARVLALLSPTERTALRLRHAHGLADRAIAERMAVSTAAVRKLIAHGEATLRAAQRAFIDALIEDRR